MAEYNEDAYKLARKTHIEHSCPFERALLSLCASCGRSRKINLAEREAIACGDPVVREHCLRFYQALHDNAQFALKIAPVENRPSPQPSPSGGEGANVMPKPTNAPWPFGKEIRAQCGGVRGLAAAMDRAGDGTTDIAAAVLQGNERFGGIDGFPYSEIMRAVVHYEPRKRRS
ncbi:MAG: hypothetical protein QG662_1787 [Pseudomonadota bacterium]|nr:hypothetical protein [Pseudomonadota bacterium]